MGADTCKACGGLNQDCCGTNNAGTCTPPANSAQQLGCTGRANQMGIPGKCTTCGATGEPCCGGECALANRCVNNVCQACGKMGQVCCNSAGTLGDCAAGLACNGPSGNTASTCGPPGAPPPPVGQPRDAGPG